MQTYISFVGCRRVLVDNCERLVAARAGIPRLWSLKSGAHRHDFRARLVLISTITAVARRCEPACYILHCQALVYFLPQLCATLFDLQPSATPLLPHMGALKDNLGDALFGIETESVYKNNESDEEPPYSQREAVRKISCHISEKTAHLYNAIELSLVETIEKHSALLGREAQYTKTSKLARLPPYLAVQFVRFAWRKDTNQRAKIVRAVTFPEVLDVRNLCSDKLRASIAAHCDTLEQAKAAELAAKAEQLGKAADAESVPSGAQPMETDSTSSAAPTTFGTFSDVMATPADNKTGRYELISIITHQGRTAEGGHYVAWVKQSAKKWLVFDDETVAQVDAERIKELYGGSGDWHIAYMCLFRKMETLSIETGMDKA